MQVSSLPSDTDNLILQHRENRRRKHPVVVHSRTDHHARGANRGKHASAVPHTLLPQYTIPSNSSVDNGYALDLLFSPLITSLFPVATITSPYIDSYTDETLLRYFYPYLRSTVSFSRTSHR